MLLEFLLKLIKVTKQVLMWQARISWSCIKLSALENVKDFPCLSCRSAVAHDCLSFCFLCFTLKLQNPTYFFLCFLWWYQTHLLFYWKPHFSPLSNPPLPLSISKEILIDFFSLKNSPPLQLFGRNRSWDFWRWKNKWLHPQVIFF